MLLGRYKQTPYDKRKRGIEYEDFLEEDEEISSIAEILVTPVTDPPFLVTNAIIDPDGKKIAYYAGGGVDGETYSIAVRTITSLAQRREDTIEFDVAEDD